MDPDQQHDMTTYPSSGVSVCLSAVNYEQKAYPLLGAVVEHMDPRVRQWIRINKSMTAYPSSVVTVCLSSVNSEP